MKNKTAIVTGAGSGIGRGIAIAFAKAGANVVVADIDDKGGRETMDAIKAEGGEATFIKGDVTNPEYHLDLVAQAKSIYGKLEVAVNNAGISTVPTPLADIPLELWDKVIAINLSGMFYGVRAQIPALIEAGGGVIVNMSSIAGSIGAAGIGHYTASKHGVVGLTKTIAVDYAKRGIRANAVGPGYINTELVNLYPPDERARLAGMHPMGRLGEVREVVDLVLFLASPLASFITGAYVPVDGGYLAQ
jgi:NAD(P)-dependent dehydrogenase (short-subunit alcohol dehydrogenase family)